MTLALECGLLTPWLHYSFYTSFADESWYDYQCIALSLV